MSHKIRSLKAEFVTKSLKERRARFADQRSVWNGVSEMLYALGAASPTSVLSDGFDGRANAVADFLAAFKLQSLQVGVVYRISDMLIGLDLLGSESAFARAFPKLMRGLALQALAGYEKDGSSPSEEAFLGTVLRASADCFPAVGLGEELRFDTEDVGGGALRLDGSLVHLFAFPRRYRAAGIVANRRNQL